MNTLTLPIDFFFPKSTGLALPLVSIYMPTDYEFKIYYYNPTRRYVNFEIYIYK